MLEVFNTLLRQLRLSIDYALTGSYDCTAGVSTKIIKEHEERMFQEAVIKTIGGASCGAWRCAGVGAFCLCVSGLKRNPPRPKNSPGKWDLSLVWLWVIARWHRSPSNPRRSCGVRAEPCFSPGGRP